MLVYQSVQYLVNVDLGSGFNPSEKYESQFGLLFPIYGKIQNLPIHQPVMLVIFGENCPGVPSLVSAQRFFCDIIWVCMKNGPLVPLDLMFDHHFPSC
jgi:hypothetical protein